MSDRMRRVNEAVRAVLAEAVGELKDPRGGFITVTGVVTFRDLGQATVYVRVLGPAAEASAVARGARSGARRAAAANRGRAEAEAHASIDLPIRSLGRTGCS